MYLSQQDPYITPSATLVDIREGTSTDAESLGSRRDVKLLALARPAPTRRRAIRCACINGGTAAKEDKRARSSTYSFAHGRQVAHRAGRGTRNERSTDSHFVLCACTGVWRVPRGLHVPRPVSLLLHGNGRGARQIREGQAPGIRRDGWPTNGSPDGCPTSSQHSLSLTHSLTSLDPRASWVLQRCCGWLERDSKALELVQHSTLDGLQESYPAPETQLRGSCSVGYTACRCVAKTVRSYLVLVLTAPPWAQGSESSGTCQIVRLQEPDRNEDRVQVVRTEGGSPQPKVVWI
ncbi:hypothetical protein CCMA1212_007291 [Trichoderma ghanense]|uniref:Uncharacterized protein n=1 Tax=Trichoderma ghanense TaxID=65468 RepID=A0ABY2H068_9HYPO